MLNQKIRSGWDRLMKPIGRWLARGGLSPDAVTLVGVMLQVAASALILQGRLLVAGIVATGAGLADVADGAVAKASGRTGRWGAFFDSSTDRLSDALLFGALVWLYGVDPDIGSHDEPWVAAVALGTLVVSFLVSYTKARAESLGYECNVGIAERAERLIIVILGLILDIVPVALIVLAVLATVTLIQRLVHVRRQEDRAL
ncbi:MAG: phosphatidylinositol phosphate synthase [Actinomycetota bacterium]